MYSFLRRPIWILSHVLIGILVLSLIGLGLWQRSRWIEESDKVARNEERARAEAVGFDEVVDPSEVDFAAVPESDRYTRVVVSGTYDAEAEVSIRNRSQGGAPGAWVLTPLIQADGTAVPVVRGWIPLGSADSAPPFADSEPPGGPVTVTGNLQLTQARGSIGAVDPQEGTLTELARVDLARLQQQLPYELRPAWVLLDGQEPPQPGVYPEPIELLTDDPSQNFSYMMQWWIFALIAACGYPLVLRMVARNRAKGDQVPIDEEEPVASAL